MANYTIPDQIIIPQSVGPHEEPDNENSGVFNVFQPKQGRDLFYLNPLQNSGSTEIVDDFDKRLPLGTYTLNDRGLWESNITNKENYIPHFSGDPDNKKPGFLEQTIEVITPNGRITDVRGNWASSDLDWSVDALPFVIDPNSDEIIHLDRYYDKDIDREEYKLATEGKVNYYLGLSESGRISGSIFPDTYTAKPHPTGQIYSIQEIDLDIFTSRPRKTKFTGMNFFDYYLDETAETDRGFYLFKLNWGDGTPEEYTNKPKLLESTVIFEHFYEKPGFYTITGMIYQYTGDKVRQYERFKTNILLNPSPNYKLNLYDNNNFASIGNFSKNSSFVKSLYNLVAIDPMSPYSNERADMANIEKINNLDRIQMLNILGKVDYSLIQPYFDYISPYQVEIEDVPTGVLGCMDSAASNFNPDASIDDGTCNYIHEMIFHVVAEMNSATIQFPSDEVNVNITHNGNTETFAGGVPFEINRGINTISIDADWEDLSNNDWEFLGLWNDVEHLTDNSEITMDILNDNHNFIAKFQYVDDTPPGPIVDFTVWNKEAWGDGWYPINENEIRARFSPPTIIPDDLSYFEIRLKHWDYINDMWVIDEVEQHQFNSGESLAEIMYNFPNLPYRDYQISIRSVDENDNSSEWSNSEYIRPTPTDLVPNSITFPNNIDHMEYIEFATLKLNWNSVSIYDEGIEGDFGHYRIRLMNNNGTLLADESITDINTSQYEYNYIGELEGYSVDNPASNPMLPPGGYNFLIAVVDGTGNSSGFIQKSITVEEWVDPNVATLTQPEHTAIDTWFMWFGQFGDTQPTQPNALPSVNVENLNVPWNFNVRFQNQADMETVPFSIPWAWAAYVVWFSEVDEEWTDIMLGYQEYVPGASNLGGYGTHTITGGDTSQSQSGNVYQLTNWSWALNQVRNSTQPTDEVFYFIEVNDHATGRMIRSTLGTFENLF